MPYKCPCIMGYHPTYSNCLRWFHPVGQLGYKLTCIKKIVPTCRQGLFPIKLWSWRESNPRPDKAYQGFLHAQVLLVCRDLQGAISNLRRSLFPLSHAAPEPCNTSSDCSKLIIHVSEQTHMGAKATLFLELGCHGVVVLAV
jgi:hypothetical protein